MNFKGSTTDGNMNVNVKQGTVYVRNADGSLSTIGGNKGGQPGAPNQPGTAPAAPAVPTAPANPIVPGQAPAVPANPTNPGQIPGQQSAAPAAPAAPAEPDRPLTPMEQFHRSLDPNKVELVWDPNFGKMRVVQRNQPGMETEGGDPGAGGDDAGEHEVPRLTGLNQNIPGGSEAAAAAAQGQPSGGGSNEVAELRTQLGQLTNAFVAMAQRMNGGQAGQVAAPVTPTAPAAPDYSQVDMYDPMQAAQLVQDVVRREISNSMQQHQPTLAAAKGQQERNFIQSKYGADPNHASRAAITEKLIQASGNPDVSFAQTYELVAAINGMGGAAGSAPATPSNSTSQNPTTPQSQAAVNNATRTTLTPEQQEAMAEKARRLPQSSGVRGGGKVEPPEYITDLGQLIVWSAQNESLGRH
jgi:hypothetical protein